MLAASKQIEKIVAPSTKLTPVGLVQDSKQDIPKLLPPKLKFAAESPGRLKLVTSTKLTTEGSQSIEKASAVISSKS